MQHCQTVQFDKCFTKLNNAVSPPDNEFFSSEKPLFHVMMPDQNQSTLRSGCIQRYGPWQLQLHNITSVALTKLAAFISNEGHLNYFLLDDIQ